jgi:hypothetical protein
MPQRATSSFTVDKKDFTPAEWTGGGLGSFLLLHQAMQPGPATWTIAAGSGTGELAGISGNAEILPGHQFTLDYEL